MKRTWFLAGFLLFFFFVGFSAVPSFAAEDPNAAGRYGLRDAADEAGLASVGGGGNLPALAGTVIGSLLSITGIAFFMLSVYGGFLWMTARGNEPQIESGRNTLKAAIIGIIIVIASYAITNLVLEAYKAPPSSRTRTPPAGTPTAPARPGSSSGGGEEVGCCTYYEVIEVDLGTGATRRRETQRELHKLLTTNASRCQSICQDLRGSEECRFTPGDAATRQCE